MSGVLWHSERVTPLRPADPFGALWCEQHARRECAKHRQSDGGRCHGSAISGLNACKKHAGESTTAAVAKGQAALVRQRFRDVSPSEYVDPGDVLLWTVTLARIDLADYRAELHDKAKAGPVDSEDLDRLSRLQFDASRMAKLALDAKVDERRVHAAEVLGDRLIVLVRGLVTGLGHDPDDPAVASVARSHLELMAGAAA